MRSLAAALSLALAGAVSAAAAEPKVVWEAEGFKTPESVLAVPAEGIAYVSNVAGQPTDKDGNGFISKLSLADGKVTTPEWVKGLDGPKGMALSDGKLYVADIDKLVEIDPKAGKIVTKYEAPGAVFLNDVTSDGQGNVYVSDSSTSAIWRLAAGKLEKWLEGPELKFPNGLKVVGDKLILAAWGAPGTSAPKSEPANLLAINLADKKVSNLGDGTPVGNLDGLEPDGDDFLVTDWVAGKVFRIAKSGKADVLLTLKQGTADIGYVPSEKLLVVPLMMNDKVVAYRLQ
jgi:sugar lactone lactonase YvrE